MTTGQLQPVLDARTRLGESPVWSAERRMLFFVDIKGRALHRFDPATRSHRVDAVDEDIGCVAPAAGGGFVAATRSGIWLLDDGAAKRRMIAANPEDPAVSRFNDGRIDPAGRLIVGTVDEPKAGGKAGLYRLDGDRLTRLLDGLLTSNGLAFSPDGRTLYHADTPRFAVRCYDYDVATGAIANPRLFAQLDPDAADRGRPDGAAVDAEGCYWTALYEGGRVQRYDPHGALMAEYPLPARKPTMVAFGGAALKTLFVTTAEGDGGGALFAMAVDVPGLVPPPFAGAAR
ncbi:MAG: gluconolactonase [Sphingomonas sp. SCN 67-18]|uniref:SMP-30/gluconolactonase/LRE family protein n=1 Tax=uncultured Sphingomonas sp. TaxID=158754 RepID=UPI00086C3A52|nr:SMP-30/gluconolactonase/LRE family protein [Sphingomonas sp. SCN 67-18]ODU21818.1 MAG: gluconolactonase [Sphingomonas sp. SCN 67-18]